MLIKSTMYSGHVCCVKNNGINVTKGSNVTKGGNVVKGGNMAKMMTNNMMQPTLNSLSTVGVMLACTLGYLYSLWSVKLATLHSTSFFF